MSALVASSWQHLFVVSGSLHQQKPAWGVSHVCGATQASGEALYTLDQPVTKEGLWAAYVGSEHSLARVDAVDASKALQLPGVVAYINAEDIPEDGVNDCMGQEPVFTEGLVEYLGQPIGLIVAEDRAAAETGAQLVKVRKRVGRGWGAVARLHPSFELELAGGDSRDKVGALAKGHVRQRLVGLLFLKGARWDLQGVYVGVVCGGETHSEQGGTFVLDDGRRGEEVSVCSTSLCAGAFAWA